MQISLAKDESAVINGRVRLVISNDQRAVFDVEPNYRKPVLSHDEMDELLRRDRQIPEVTP